jgi:hypothetical protein
LFGDGGVLKIPKGGIGAMNRSGKRWILASLLTLCGLGLPLAKALAQDSDEDGLPDAWENAYPSCMKVNVIDNLEDYDLDGLNNQAEYDNLTDPCNSDTDGDTLPDGDEVNLYLAPHENLWVNLSHD